MQPEMRPTVMQSVFDDIRPYNLSEIPSAMQRIADSEHFGVLSDYIFPGRETEEIRAMVRSIRTVDEFQQQVMYCFNEQIIARSITRFTCDGLGAPDPGRNCLFISNHRDIVLDSSLLQHILYRNGFGTTEITFGSNLMNTQLAVDIGKANKMFTVIRSGNMREFIRNSMHLSAYIRYTLTEKGTSVWIAQRNGRTKDGNDLTDQGIIKMFCMSSRTDDPAKAVDDLHIVPVAISYQIESCDLLKTRELYLSRHGRKYVKQPGEDLNSILTGILQPKGCVHIHICEPLAADELGGIDYKNPNEFYKAVAALIDERIHRHYRLYNNNFIAHDLRSGRAAYAHCYTPEEKEWFQARCARMLQQIDGDRETLRSIFLGIYANSVDNVVNRAVDRPEQQLAEMFTSGDTRTTTTHPSVKPNERQH
jgi:1-acyl-sn-glycerol-3-phosphate acyltransferase